jgi:hypothetical protein
MPSLPQWPSWPSSFLLLRLSSLVLRPSSPVQQLSSRVSLP